jgi:UDP-2,3-diacylglucosamine pyrophosphatase LpxH
MKIKKRKVEVVIISDVHLGTYGCHAKELLKYLKTIKPEILILNGDIIDMWQFSKKYWPKSHMKVIKHITGLIGKGIPVYYVTGNHDEMLRKFVGFKIGSFKIVNKVVLNLNGEKAWIFHGDVFDVTMKYSKWLAKLGGKGYELLILLNKLVNKISEKLGKGKISLSKKIKNNVKSAVKYINSFENVAAHIAISKKYTYVICGHIHQPVIKEIKNDQGKVTYLNSGDWVENLTALEYNAGRWSIYRFENDLYAKNLEVPDGKESMRNTELFDLLIKELSIVA